MKWGYGWKPSRTSGCKAGLNSNSVPVTTVLYEFDVPLGRIFRHFVGNRWEIYKRAY